MIAVCLLTCGRPELTEKTATSFRRHNHSRSDLILWHADGGPRDDQQKRNFMTALECGFNTIEKPDYRVGQIESFRAFMSACRNNPVEFMLWLENDWESTHPIPTLEFLRSFAEVDQWRLYGKAKMATAGPRKMAGTKRLGSDELIAWRPSQVVKGWDFAPLAHWAAGGTIVRPHLLEPFIGLPRMKDIIVAANELRTMRPTKNILNHIGLETTPGFFG